MNEGLLSQQEINSLLQKNEELNNYSGVTEGEKDVLGEVGNISMGSAAMALSEVLGKEASVSDMRIETKGLPELKDELEQNHIVLEAKFKKGLRGTTLMMLDTTKAAAIINLATGKEPTDSEAEFSDTELSNILETMNKMLSALYDSIADMLKKDISFSKPNIWILGPDTDIDETIKRINSDIVKIDFNLYIDGIDDSRVTLAFCLDAARDIVDGLSSLNDSSEPSDMGPQYEEQNKIVPEMKDTAKRPVSIQKPQFSQLKEDASAGPKQNIDLILDVPLELSVVLGNTTKTIKEVLSLNPGSVIELGKYTEEPLEVYVNGKLIAQGEVVVINENFGIRITNIISAAERVRKL